jgi:hypothetical protein
MIIVSNWLMSDIRCLLGQLLLFKDHESSLFLLLSHSSLLIQMSHNVSGSTPCISTLSCQLFRLLRNGWLAHNLSLRGRFGTLFALGLHLVDRVTLESSLDLSVASSSNLQVSISIVDEVGGEAVSIFRDLVLIDVDFSLGVLSSANHF